MPFAELSDVRMHYELLGHGDPLLMIPGLGTTCRLFDLVSPELARHFTLILVDNRDVGRSIGRRPATTLVDYASDLVELLDYLQLPTAHVLGLSFGGIIAQRLAIEHGPRIEKLALLSCSHRMGPYLKQMALLLAHTLRRFPPKLFQRTLELLTLSPQFFDAHFAEIDQKLSECKDQCVPRSAIIRQLRCLECHDVAMGGEYVIDVPTLVVSGEQDMLIPPCFAKAMADDIPGSRFLLVPECGHNPLLQRPDFLLPRLVDFFNDPKASRSGSYGSTERKVGKAEDIEVNVYAESS